MAGSRVTVRKLAARLGQSEDDVILAAWEHGEDAVKHPADHLPDETANAIATHFAGRSMRVAAGSGDLAETLKARGLHATEARQRVRRHLEQQVGSNPDLVALDAIVPLLDTQLAVFCGDPLCEAELRRHERFTLVIAGQDPARCRFCGGSDNRRAARRMARLCRDEGKRRLLVVGGSPGTHQELVDLLTDQLELRVIEGDRARTRAEAERDLEWADLCLVWGSTILNHKVSELYTDRHGSTREHVLVIRRRGVAALCDEVTEHLVRTHRPTGRPG